MAVPSVDVTVPGRAAGLATPKNIAELWNSFVPGSPPLSPGDSAGATKVVEWREQLIQSLYVAKQADVDMLLGCNFRFAVPEPRQYAAVG